LSVVIWYNLSDMNSEKIAPDSMDLPPVMPREQLVDSEQSSVSTADQKPELNQHLASTVNDNSQSKAQIDAALAVPAIPGLAGQASAQQADDSNPIIADDADVIEKEWVERAKEIVYKTKDNPYLQNKAITRMKVDYIKKRYNKDIRISGD
jgi:hypothetical protein